jgi:pyruvate kinase
VASTVVKTAIDIDAKLIVVLSETGKMARHVSKFRPGVSVLMVTPNLKAARQASGLCCGMHAIEVDSLANASELIEEVNYELVEGKMMKAGESIIVVGGVIVESLYRRDLALYLVAFSLPWYCSKEITNQSVG